MALVRQLRIFLSSPGDVAEERKIARHLVKDVFSVHPFIRGRASFDIVSWDDEAARPGMDASSNPQEAINERLPKPSECDIVIVILWSRMGTPISAEYRKADGSPYESGTEWEYEDAVSGAGERSAPVTLLYRRDEPPMIALDDPAYQKKREQYEKVKAFFARFESEDGSLRGSYTAYPGVDSFRDLLRQNLEAVISGLIGDEVSVELGVTRAAVETMLGILKEKQVPPEQLEAKLKEIAECHLELTRQLHTLAASNDEPEIGRRREQAADAIEAGNYDRAAELLAEAFAIDRRAIEEQQDALDRRKQSAAATLAQQAELERARLDYRKAAELFAEAGTLTPERDLRFEYSVEQASSLEDQGWEFGETAALSEVIEVYQRALVDRPRADFPLEWARIKNDLGVALANLGERNRDARLLEQAIDAYEAALEERLRERVPLDWAATQNNLGSALSTLGEWEPTTTRLEQAEAAYRSALEEWTRDRIPHYWAIAQSNLGNVLVDLARRQECNEKLEMAVAAFDLALDEQSCEADPLVWAASNNNLGNALSTHVDGKDETVRLEQALAAYDAALEGFSRERFPLRWAGVHQNIGIVLSTIGDRNSDVARLRLAVEAFHAALEERQRHLVPFDWALTQHDLGDVYRSIAEKTRSRTDARLGMEAIAAAIAVFEETGAAKNIENARKDLAETVALLQTLGG